ncbi:FadR/GntR family transcriptional regulator [Mesorhizobium sp. J428]|uniref:FadR/GntR family transcriptional regulator n=1 Tax=Mesorhizobium sp. J428 TaxID=2898440 RepID=UPI002150E186|nr:FadR/GntR family transcriptional regulator [Mesorhizobium sp. J428]MCR5858141.1 FadR family transcriptional regulator [Mesorhizobium sp. J428]
MLKAAITGERVRNSHALVVDALGRAIVGGDYPRGSTLPGDFELAARFGVSRTVLREAMKTLAAKGMIVAKARIGTRVTDKSTWNYFDADILRWHLDNGADSRFMTHLAEMRLAFEPYAARLACRHATPKDVEQMLAHADAMENARSLEEFALADLAFHMALAEASKNPFMYSVGTLVEAALVTSFRLSSPFGEAARQSSSADKHRRIARAILRKDEDEAAAAVEVVITEGRDRVGSKLAEI